MKRYRTIVLRRARVDALDMAVTGNFEIESLGNPEKSLNRDIFRYFSIAFILI